MTEQEERLSNILYHYMPAGSVPQAVKWIAEHKIQLTITGKRSSLFGDYRAPEANRSHRISINGNLNKFAFLVTFLHEMAHLFTWNNAGNRVAPHGREWKTVFRQLMMEPVRNKIFPAEIEAALNSYLMKPGATQCSDENLMKALNAFNAMPSTFLGDLKMGEEFSYRGKLFSRGVKRRIRIECRIKNGESIYLFHPFTEVKRMPHRQEAEPAHTKRAS